MCLLAKDLMKLLYICTCVFLIHDILEFMYPSARDKKFSVQLDPSYFVQRKHIFRIYISKLITTQSSLSYKVVLVFDGHSNCITDTACHLVAQNSRVVTCVQIFYA